MRNNKHILVGVLVATFGVSIANPCKGNGLKCDGDVSTECDCTSSYECEEAQWGTFEKCCCTTDGNFCRIRTACEDDERDRSRLSCPRRDECEYKEYCDVVGQETCENGCIPGLGRCRKDNEVCSAQWPASEDAVCEPGAAALPPEYSSWKHVTNAMGSHQQSAREEMSRFNELIASVVIPRTACHPANLSICYTGTIPAELEPAAFFSKTGQQSFSAPTAPDPAYTVSTDVSQCTASWTKYVCMRHFPECRSNFKVPANCYRECNAVSACLDAYLLSCLALNATRSDACEDFDWDGGAACDPGFECGAFGEETLVLARDSRLCDRPVETCAERPASLRPEGCNDADILTNLCLQFQPGPHFPASISQGSDSHALRSQSGWLLCSALLAAMAAW